MKSITAIVLASLLSACGHIVFVPAASSKSVERDCPASRATAASVDCSKQ